MQEQNEQLKEWTQEFGKEYTDRNVFSLEQLEDLYIRQYGVKRQELNKEFLERIINGHIKGTHNYVNEINTVLTLELIHRLFIDI